MILNKKTKNKTNNNILLIRILIDVDTTNTYIKHNNIQYSQIIKQANIYYRKGSVKSWIF